MLETIKQNLFAMRMKIANMKRSKKYLAVLLIGFFLGCAAVGLGRPLP